MGGELDLAGYATLAQLHRPSDPAALATEIRRLHSTGLKPRDISVALRICLGEVLDAITEAIAP